MYSAYYTRNNPGLWVLLTDESEESIGVINNMILHAIEVNFNGSRVYNKCYIHVLGYNGSVKLIRSGHLEDFESHPLRVIEQEKSICDGCGGVLTVKCKIPVWAEPYNIRLNSCLLDAIDGARHFINETLEFNRDVPAPIVFNISKECSVDSKLTHAINKLKEIKVHDGSLLFVNGGVVESEESIFKEDGELCELTSKVPKSANFLYRSMIYMSHWYDRNDVEFNLSLINCSTHLSFNMMHLSELMSLFMHNGHDSLTSSVDLYAKCQEYIDNLDDKL